MGSFRIRFLCRLTEVGLARDGSGFSDIIVQAGSGLSALRGLLCRDDRAFDGLADEALVGDAFVGCGVLDGAQE